MDMVDVLPDYLAAIRHLDAGSQKQYQWHLSTFADWCTSQSVALEHINNKHVQVFLVWLQSSHKPKKRGKLSLSSSTLAGYVRSLLTFLNWCLSDDEYSQYVSPRTVKQIKMPRIERFIKLTFTDEEIAALFEACKHPKKPYEYKLRDVAILALLLDTGVRAAELRTLTIGNVTFARAVCDDSYITVMGKGRKQREIPLGNRTRRALHRYLRECRKGAKRTEPVFLSRHGNQLAHESLKDMLARLLVLSGLPQETGVNPHKFRHTFATRYMAQGGEIYDLSRLLGHTSVAITETYLKSLSTQQMRHRKTPMSVLDNL